jgi:hypothetical protein
MVKGAMLKVDEALQCSFSVINAFTPGLKKGDEPQAGKVSNPCPISVVNDCSNERAPTVPMTIFRGYV